MRQFLSIGLIIAYVFAGAFLYLRAMRPDSIPAGRSGRPIFSTAIYSHRKAFFGGAGWCGSICSAVSPWQPVSGRLPPNKRLKLTGGDRLNGSGVLCADAHELSFNYTARGERVARSLSAIR